jgi:hypothetical protein
MGSGDTNQHAGSRPFVRREVGLLAVLLLVALVPRAYRLNAPFLDAWWMRDMVDHAVAVNYYEKGINLLWPETDFTPDEPNYMGMELPVLPALAALGWRVFGVHAWVPRAIAIAWSLLGIGAFYFLARRFLTLHGAFAATLLFALMPINAFLGRKFMNEPVTLTASLLCVLLFVRWVDGGRTIDLVGAAIAGAFAAVTKPTAIHFVLPLAWYLWHRKGWPGFLDVRVLLCTAFVLVPIPLYMKHMAAIRETYWGIGTHAQGGMWFSFGQLTSPAVWSLFVDRFTKIVLTPIGIAGVATGLALIKPKRAEWFWVAWFMAAVVYLIVVLGGNARQAYYQLWFVAPCAGIAGFAWQTVRRYVPDGRWLAPLVGGTLVVWCAWGVQPLFESEDYVLKAAPALDHVVPEDSWIIVYPAGYNCLYYLNRDGWCGRDVRFPTPWEAPGNPRYIEDRVKRGAKFCVIFTGSTSATTRDTVVESYLADAADRVYHDPDFDVYRLNQDAPPRR